jgi:diguanylate cyclase (GGDEF)-like protein/putative nucleotidyltransferase with HDIG domain
MFGTSSVNPSPLTVMHERIHADDRERYLATFTHAAYCRLEPIVCEFRLIQADGVERILLEQAFPRELLPDGGVRIEGFFLDVTERHEARETERRLARVLESGVLLVSTFALTERGREEQFRGPGMERFLGPNAPHDVDPWVLWDRLVDPDDRVLRATTWKAVAAGEEADMRYRVRGLDGRLRWVLEQLRPRPAARGGTRVVDSIISDITGAQVATAELAAARDEAEVRLRVDPLTGVSNRMHLVDQLERELDVARNEGGVPAVVLLDIDHFKRINDLYLHSAGDRVLCEVAERIAGACRPQDAFGRWGGEEFVVIVRDAPTGPALRQIASRIRDSIGEVLFDVQGEPIRITASAGVARADQGTATVIDVFDAADRALYTAKRAGRDQLRMSEQVDERELLAGEPDVIRIAEAVSRSASAREGESELHCALVARLSGEVGAALGLGPAAQLRCRLAGLMHDIGKMAIPDSILAKPGALNDEEWEVMRHHAPFGAEIVSRIAGLADTALAVRHHHERWDGNGYPDRLAGEEIPIEARIIAAVDSFCAMTEDRVYRKAMPLADAIAELEECRGKQFDPDVADALIAVVGGGQQLPLAA